MGTTFEEGIEMINSCLFGYPFPSFSFGLFSECPLTYVCTLVLVSLEYPMLFATYVAIFSTYVVYARMPKLIFKRPLRDDYDDYQSN